MCLGTAIEKASRGGNDRNPIIKLTQLTEIAGYLPKGGYFSFPCFHVTYIKMIVSITIITSKSVKLIVMAFPLSGYRPETAHGLPVYFNRLCRLCGLF